MATIRQGSWAVMTCIGQRMFSVSAVAASRRSQLRKPNISTLTKHLKPDGLTGKERRNVLRERLRYAPSKARNGPYIPIKKRLEPVPLTAVKALSKAADVERFDDLGLSPVIVTGVQSVLNNPLCKPTEIQALTIPRVLRSKHSQHILCAAETGSGKTLAYTLPILDRLKADERLGKRRLDHPRMIVLVPTRELVTQVTKVCKSLAHVVKFRTLGLDSRMSRSRLVEALADGPIDVLVCTPTTLRSYLDDHTLSLSDTRYLVVDEADSLFDAGWGDDCRAMIKRVQRANESQGRRETILVVSATLPRSVHTVLDTLFPSLEKITTPSFHRALPNLKQSFVDLDRYQGNRQLALVDILKKNIKDDKTLVFCNTRHGADLLYRWITSKGIKALTLYKDMQGDRTETLQQFSDPDSDEQILICTDIASRGIDTTCVDHVVLYDFPTSAVDYLHRVGRTARAGRTGKATSLIGRKDRMMADRIRRAIREGQVMT